MIYKMTLKDSTDEMTFNLLEVPIVDKDIEGSVDNVTLDGNQYTDYLYLKKQYIQKWSIMCDEEYERLRGFYTRQFDEAEIPTYELYYGETIYNEYTRSGDYILVDVQGVEPARMSLAQIDGNATQATYSGKNQLAYTLESLKLANSAGGTWSGNSYTYNGITYKVNDDLTVTATGTANGASFFIINNSLSLTSDSAYTLSGCPSGGAVTGYSMRLYGDGSYTSDIGAGLSFSYSDQNLVRINVYTGVNIGTKTFEPMIELGSTKTNYEPYVGGTASPNPDYPQEIQTVTGENVVKVVGKNLWGGVFESGIINGTTGQDAPNASYIRSKDYIPVEENTSYTVSSPDFSGSWLWYEYRADKTYNLTTNKGGTSFTTEAGTRFVRFRPNSATLTTSTKAQVELGSTATSYQAYTEQSFTIDLGNEELAKIGTYQDRIYKDGGKWYVEKQLGKKIFDGTESWTTSPYGTNSWTSGIVLFQFDTSKTQVVSNIFRGVPNDDRATSGENIIYSGNANTLYIRNTTLTTLASVQSATSGNYIYYALATPTVTEITNQALIDQLEALTNVSIATGIHNIFTEVASGNLNPTMIFNFIEVVSRRVTLVPETPVRLTLTDGGIINACGCRKDVQLTMRETIE